MLDGQFPIESQVGLSGVIASNSAKLPKANFGGTTPLPSGSPLSQHDENPLDNPT